MPIKSEYLKFFLVELLGENIDNLIFFYLEFYFNYSIYNKLSNIMMMNFNIFTFYIKH
jgi:hypothetical protein